MSNSNEILKKCCRCQNILLKFNFNKDNKRRDGVQRICIICFKDYHNNRKERRSILDKERRKTDLNFKLVCNLRSITTKAFKAQNVRKTDKTFELLLAERVIRTVRNLLRKPVFEKEKLTGYLNYHLLLSNIIIPFTIQ